MCATTQTRRLCCDTVFVEKARSQWNRESNPSPAKGLGFKPAHSLRAFSASFGSPLRIPAPETTGPRSVPLAHTLPPHGQLSI